MQKISTTTLVVAAALIGADDRVLMQKRRTDRQHGGLWEFPGGKVEPSESPDAALIRELNEELGIIVAASDLDPVSFAAGQNGAGRAAGSIVILLYTCRKWAGELRNLDAEEIGWFDPVAACHLEMPPLDIPLAKKLADRLK